MTKIKRMLRCYNCGALLQSKNQKEDGYIDKSFLASPNAENEVLYCTSCYEKMRAINASMLEQDVDDEILTILDDAVATDAMIIWVIDTFSFNGTFNPDIVKKIKKLKVVVIGNKFDLLSKKIKKEHMVKFIEDRFKEAGITPFSIILFENAESIESASLIERMNVAREGHDVYMIGSMASGKTSVINKSMKYFKNKTKRVIKTEKYPGTSVNVLEIPLSNSSFFYEVPGFSLVNTVFGKTEPFVQKLILPKKEIKTFYRLLNLGEAIMIGSLAAFALLKGKPTSMRFYSAEGVECKKVSYKKLFDAFEENLDKKTLRPVSDRLNTFVDFDVFEITMDNDGLLHDISISGLGWLSFVAKGQTIFVLAPKGATIKETVSKMSK